MNQQLSRILIAATGSGNGKTTLTCGFLHALKERNMKVAAFKCGPDYIDPMFHTNVVGIPSRNLDLFFSDVDSVNQLLCKHGESSELAVIEGAMGFYDGIGGISSEASSYDLADKTQTPVILLVDCSGKSVSIIAEIKGFLSYVPESHIKGILLNKISPMLYEEMKQQIEEQLPIRVCGYMPKIDACSLESRHLGLITAEEVLNLKEIVTNIATQIEKTVDVDGIIDIAKCAPPLSEKSPAIKNTLPTPVRIAVARDKAFCFYYQDNLDLLRDSGGEIIYFSPLQEENLPEDISGIIIGGGYPELYLEKLSENVAIRNQIKDAIDKGMPCIAECGGFMYLHEELENREGLTLPMVGAIKGKSFPTEKLSRFGYVTLTAERDTILCKKGESIKGHEFHYWYSTNPGNAFLAEKPLRKAKWNCIITEKNMVAGYPHLYFYNQPEIAWNFVNACTEFKKDVVNKKTPYL